MIQPPHTVTQLGRELAGVGYGGYGWDGGARFIAKRVVRVKVKGKA